MIVILYLFLQNAVEPMQVDAPPEDNDNNEEEPYVVENPSLVCCAAGFCKFMF
jgi:COP9 signalosome complex subunit 1